MKRLVSRFLVLTLLAVGAGAGCGGDTGTPDAGTTARGPRGTGMTVTQMLGASGGSLTLEGTTVAVPPGALSGDLSLSITSSPAEAPAGYQTSTPVFRFGPAGTMFGAPVTVTLTVPDGTGASSIYWSRTDGSGFDALPTTRFGNQLTASVAHFSEGFVALAPGEAPDGGACSGTLCGETCVQTGSDPTNCGRCGNVCGAGFRCVMGFCFAPSGRDAGPDTGVDVPLAVDTGGPVDVGVDPGSDVPVPLDVGFDAGVADVVVPMDRGGPLDVGVDPGSDVPVDVGFDAGVADVVVPMDRGGPLDVGVDPGCGPAMAGGGGGSCTGSQTCGGVAFALSCSPMGCSCTRNGVMTTTFAVGTTCGSPTSIGAALTAQCRGLAVDAGMIDVPVVDVPVIDVGVDAGVDTGVAPSCDGGTVCSGACRLLATDPANCGACGRACDAPPTMVATCTAGACGSRCATNNRDCNMSPSDGCEVNVGTDVANCGACGSVCSASNGVARCVAGACSIGACNEGFADCDRNAANGCEASVTTNANCGGCGVACGVNQVCMAGACVVSCPPGQANCGGTCADLQTNVANCGACGTACGAGQACIAGACTAACAPGEMRCGAVCANPQTNAANCGSCGTACPAINSVASCVAGACRLGACLTGFADCDANAANGCEVNTRTSPTNCGRCGGACDIPHATPACVAGACAIGSCAPGFADCDGALNTGCEVDLRSSATNCGRCGTACGVNQVCMSGACVVSCPAGQANCGGTCADLQSNAAHCGACGTACGAGRVCNNGVCM